MDISGKKCAVNEGSELNTDSVSFNGDKLEVRGNLRFLQGASGVLNFVSPFPCLDIFGGIEGQNLKIAGNLTVLRNWGNVNVTNLEISLNPMLADMLHYGTLLAHRWMLSCRELTNGDSRNNARIFVDEWTMRNPASITVAAGTVQVGQMKGDIGSVNLLNNRCLMNINKLDGNIHNAVDNTKGQFSIGESNSPKPYTLITRGNGAESSIGSSNTSLSGVISRDGAVSRIQGASGISFMSVKQSDAELSHATGVKHLHVTGDSAVTINQSNLGSAHFGTGTRTDIRKSKVDDGVNQGGMYAENTEMGRFVNRSSNAFQAEKAAVIFSQQNSVKEVTNDGVIYGTNGESYFGDYFGKNSDARIELIETKGAPLVESEESNNMFQGRGATIYADKIRGKTTVKAPQSTLRKGFVPGLQFVDSNVSVYLDYMPSVTEFPVRQGGSLNLRVKLSHDYVNNSNKIFGDAIFFIDMNGYNWKNINADFATKGLEITNAGIMGNYNGRLALEDFLAIKADEIINKADPVHTTRGHQSNVHLYLQQNRTAGMFAGGNVSFDAGRVHNSFATMASRNGNINGKATSEIRNTGGTLSGRSGHLASPNIVNEDAGIGSSMVRRRVWFLDIYTAELWNKSDGAQMRFGDRLKLEGGVQNIGSSIRSGGAIDLKGCPFFELRSFLNNRAEVGGSNIHLETEKLHGIAVQLWTAGELL